MNKQLSLPLTTQLKLASKRSNDAFRVLHGDAFDLFDQMPADSIDLVITSPPYWGHRDYGLDHNWELFNNIPKVRKVGAITPGYDWYRGEGGLLGLEPYPEWLSPTSRRFWTKLLTA